MPFKTFNNWLFDGKLDSEIPQELLKSNSPISNLYCISLFMKCGSLNHYLNKYLNNYGVFYLPKDELFRFVKRCIKDFKISKSNIWYFSKREKKNELFDELRDRYPTLKDFEVIDLCDIIYKSKNKNEILESLGLKTDVKKEKTKKKTKKEKSVSKVVEGEDVNSFLNRNFVFVEVDKKL